MKQLIENILLTLDKYDNDNITAKELIRISNKLYKLLPNNDNDFISVCDALMSYKKPYLFWLVTIWIKRRSTVYELKYFNYYEKWLFNYVDSWKACDVYCYRVLNPMIEKYNKLYKNILNWTKSKKIYVVRASAVSMIQSSRSFKINQPFTKVVTICDILKGNNHIHIQKAIGWLLKYAFLSYPEDTINYLKENVNLLSRTTFRYALKKMPVELRKELMKL